MKYIRGIKYNIQSGQFMLDSESSLREAVRKRLRARKASMNSSKMKE